LYAAPRAVFHGEDGPRASDVGTSLTCVCHGCQQHIDRDRAGLLSCWTQPFGKGATGAGCAARTCDATRGQAASRRPSRYGTVGARGGARAALAFENSSASLRRHRGGGQDWPARGRLLVRPADLRATDRASRRESPARTTTVLADPAVTTGIRPGSALPRLLHALGSRAVVVPSAESKMAFSDVRDAATGTLPPPM
jgi:hypothetical protein